MKPTVLIATTRRWFPTARLAMALANAGCAVEAVCPPGHPLGQTNAVQRIHSYRGLTPLISFASAISAAKPDFVAPGDDLATQHLQQLHDQEQRRGIAGPLCALIERSLGSPESFPIVYGRSEFIEVARQQGVRVPKTEIVANLNDLRRWIAQMGLPTVLKTNGSSGGDGVRVVHTIEDAERAFHTLNAPPLLTRAIKRAVVDQDKTLIWPSLLRRRPAVNAQAFVPGREATSAIFCWEGSVLASLHFEVIAKAQQAGHATAIRLIEHSEMSSAAEKIVRQLNLSGLHGLDFMLEGGTGNAYLLEINPRSTQVGHLTLGPGRDLPAALYASLSGKIVQPSRKITENDMITLFPQEWIRDPNSPLLQSGYHDVPWEEPELIRACVRARRKQSSWYSHQNWIQASSPIRVPRS